MACGHVLQDEGFMEWHGDPSSSEDEEARDEVVEAEVGSGALDVDEQIEAQGEMEGSSTDDDQPGELVDFSSESDEEEEHPAHGLFGQHHLQGPAPGPQGEGHAHAHAHGAPPAAARGADAGRPHAPPHAAAHDMEGAGGGDVDMDGRAEEHAGPGAAARDAGSRAVAAGGRDHDSDSSDTDGPIEFSEDEEDELDTTAEQLAAGQRDIQGIPWDRLQFSRSHYRDTRLRQYRNYVNLLPEDPAEFRPELLKACAPVSRHGVFYDFVRNNRAVHSSIVHFQLRNLVWALSRNDVLVVRDNCVVHWSPATRTATEVLSLAGGGRGARATGLGRVQVSTLAVAEGLVAAGGFGGELVVMRLGATPSEPLAYAGRVTNSDNGITNGIEVFSSPLYGGPCVMTSNNDSAVRVFAAGAGFKRVLAAPFPWAVNYATLQPGGHVVAVVGDDPTTVLTDLRTGATVGKLAAQRDYAFAAAWHPHGNLLATGNQDTTTAVWDVRAPGTPLLQLAGRMGAIRSLRFSADGKFLAAAEPADFVHIYDVAAGFSTCQEVDLFGEISGVSFTPAADALFIGISDVTYSSLLQFDRHVPAGLHDALDALF